MMQSPINQIDKKEVDKNALMKYTTYIYQLIGALDKGHFASCCFEERFSKDVNLNQLAYTDDHSTVLLQAFKYISDLLMNISTIQHLNTPPDSGLSVKSGNIRSFLEKSQRQFNDLFDIEDENERETTNSKVTEKLTKKKSEEQFASQFSSKKNSESEFSLGGERVERLKDLNSLRSSLKNSPQLNAARKHELNNYISVSEIDSTAHQAHQAILKQQSKDTDSAYESPKFSKYERPHHTEPNEYSSQDRDEILQIDESAGRGGGRLGKQELMVRFKELRARCKELKEQDGVVAESPALQKPKKQGGDIRCWSERDIDQEEEAVVKVNNKMIQSNSATHLKSLLTKETPTIVVKKSNHIHSNSTASIFFLVISLSNSLKKKVKNIRQV